MISDDGSPPLRPEDMVALLDPRGRVVWRLRPPRRVTRSWTCAVGPRGVTLYRWPLRSAFVPLERVDRFDVLREQHVLDAFGHAVERLALFTTDGARVRATGLLNALVSSRLRLPHAARAQKLNNHIAAIRRAACGQPAVHRDAVPRETQTRPSKRIVAGTAQMGGTMTRWLVACVVVAGALTGAAAEAGAREPAVQACVGTTFSEAAHTIHDLGAPPGTLGHIVSGFAQEYDGQLIQELQAGQVPDSLAVNTCSD